MYKVKVAQHALDAELIIKDDRLWIPTDPANSDYQEYLAWVAEGNTPEPWENTNGPQ